MARSQDSYNKKEKEKKRKKKQQDKMQRREERKAASAENEGGFDSMITYVDENGNFTDVPPDLTKKKKIDAESIEIGIPKREEEEVETVRKGRIEFFNDSKGFGFIKEDETNEKFFVHINGLLDDVIENDKVTFELEKGLKGLNAVRVKKV